MRVLILMAAIALVGCKSEPLHRSDPTSAFGRLRTCVDNASSGCLFRELDRDSRWSVHSIHRTLVETRNLVEVSYPKDEAVRQRALGTWVEEAAAESAEEMFVVFCKKRSCLRALAQGFGAVVKVEDQNETHTKISTTREKTFEMGKAGDEWGLSIYQDEFQNAKIRLMDNLEQVRRNAAEYDQQRLATGTHKETE